MIKHENNQVILSGNTAKAFHAKMNKPSKETMSKRNAYIKQIERNLNVKTVGGKIIIK